MLASGPDALVNEIYEHNSFRLGENSTGHGHACLPGPTYRLGVRLMNANSAGCYQDYVESTTQQTIEFLDSLLDDAESQMYSSDQWDLLCTIAEWVSIRADELHAKEAKTQMN
jgi:hypothetical protein